MDGRYAHTHGDVSALEQHQQSALAIASAREKHYAQV